MTAPEPTKPPGFFQPLLTLLRERSLRRHLVAPVACGVAAAIAVSPVGPPGRASAGVQQPVCLALLLIGTWACYVALASRFTQWPAHRLARWATVGWSAWTFAFVGLRAVFLTAPRQEEVSYCLFLGVVWIAFVGVVATMLPLMERPLGSVQCVWTTRRASAIVLVAAGAYMVLFTCRSLANHALFQTSLFDLGIIDQAVWNTRHGRWLVETVNNARPVCRPLGGHVEIMMLPLALLYFVREDVRWLLWAQSCLVALGAVPVFWIASHRLGRNLGLAFALAYLAFPATQHTTLNNFHSLAASIAMLLFMLHYLQQSRGGMVVLFAALALLCREDVSLPVFFTGLVVAIPHRTRRLGLALAGMAATWGAICFIFLPMVGNHGAADWLWWPPANPTDASVGSVLTALLTHPLTALRRAASAHLALYALKLLLPLGALSIGGLGWLLPAVPTLTYYAMSGNEAMTDITHHYASPVIPFLFVAAIVGADRLKARAAQRGCSHRLFSLAMGTYVLGSTLVFGRVLGPSLSPPAVSARHTRALRTVLHAIPPNVPLATCRPLGPHVSHRQELYYWRDVMHTRPLYAVQDFSVPWIQCLAASSQPPLALEPPDPPTSAILRDRNYGVCFAADNVWLFRRGCDHEQGLSSLLYQSPPPEAARPESVAGDARALPELTYSVVASHYPLRSDIHHVHLDLYWRAPASRAGTRFGFGVRLRGRTHWVCYEPAFGLVPSERWRPHAIVRDQLVVHITNPEGAPSATLLVKVDTSDGRRGYVATVRRIVFR